MVELQPEVLATDNQKLWCVWYLFKRENLEWTSLLQVLRAPPVAVIGLGAAASLLLRGRGAALRRCWLRWLVSGRKRGRGLSRPPATCLFTRGCSHCFTCYTMGGQKKYIFSITSAGHQFYVVVSHINMPNSPKFYYLLSEIRMD